MNLKKLRDKADLSAKDVVRIVREKYRGFGVSEVCKCERPEYYGIRPVKDIERMVCEASGLPVSEVREKRKKSKRVACRLTDEQYAELQVHLNGMSVQDWLDDLIRKELDGSEDSNL